MTKEHDKTAEIARALVVNDWFGATLIFELGEKQSVPLIGNKSQEETSADEQTVRESVRLLQQAGVVAFSESGDSLLLTPSGVDLYTKLVNSLEEPKN